MKKLLFLLVMASTPCIAGAYCVPGLDNALIMPSDSVRLTDEKMLEFDGTVEKHLTLDKYQFIDRSGRVLAEVDGDTWRSQHVTEKDGYLVIG